MHELLAVHPLGCELRRVLVHIHAHQPVTDLLIGPLRDRPILPLILLSCGCRFIIQCLQAHREQNKYINDKRIVALQSIHPLNLIAHFVVFKMHSFEDLFVTSNQSCLFSQIGEANIYIFFSMNIDIIFHFWSHTKIPQNKCTLKSFHSRTKCIQRLGVWILSKRN